MSRALEPAVPAELAAAIGADPAQAEGFTLLLLSMVEGWPHQAMISVGEVAVLDRDRLALALWPGSSAAAALTATARATLTAVVPPAAYELRLEARRVADLETPRAGKLARFLAVVRAASVDEAPYATLEAGVSFSLHEPEKTFARWREVRAALAATEVDG